MTRDSISTLCALVLGAALASSPSAAALLTYPGVAPCNTTLQACVTGASAGDTIQLATNIPIAEFVTIDKSLTIEPAAGFTPSVQGLFAAVTSTDLSLTVQNLAGLDTLRTVLAPGGGNLTLQVLNNVITGSSFNGAVELDAGTGAAGPYGTATVTVSGNRITQTGDTFGCADAIALIGSPASFTATIVGNDIEVDNLDQCGAVDAVIGGGAQTASVTVDRNLVHGTAFDYGILVRNFGVNPGNPGGLLTAFVSNNLVYGQNGNTGAPGGLVVTADGNNAGLTAQLVNNTVADGKLGVLVSVRDDLGAVVTGGMFNNIVAFNGAFGIEVESGATGFANSHNLTFSNASGNFFTAGPVTLTSDPLFTNRAAHDYTLSAGSSAINRGLDSALPGTFTLDLAGNPRRVGIIDMGAYESAVGGTALGRGIPVLAPATLAALAALVAFAGALAYRRRVRGKPISR